MDNTSTTILKERILLKGETPKEMFRRVANAVTKDPKLRDSYYELLSTMKFLPNSPCLMNAGTSVGQLCACFVLPIEDSMESIFTTLKDAAMVQKSGGGVGFFFGRLRPKGDRVDSTGGEASGPISFLKVYNAASEEIEQGGRRRGASLATMNDSHPDIFEFITCKRDTEQITNFNLSVGITNEFMQVVQADADFNLVNPRNGDVVKTILARELWDAIVQNAWETGEPGLLFLDTINAENPTPELGRIEACNPCFTGDMHLMMADGSYKTFEELAGGKWEIMGSDGKSSKGKVWKSGIKYTVKLNLSNGKYITCTADHKFKTINGKVKSAKNLKGETLSSVNDFAIIDLKKDYKTNLITVKSIEPNGKHPVYDFSEPRTNWGIVEGVVAHNCGEANLLPYEACVLGSINLAKFVKTSSADTLHIDFDVLNDTVSAAVRFLDNVIDVSTYLLPEIEQMTKANRKIGLGVMGWADMLFKLGVPYDSEEAISLVGQVMSYISAKAIEASEKLAEESGPFPNFDQSVYKDNVSPRRNAAVTSIAPTGTLADIVGTTYGIEPEYALVHTRRILDGKEFTVVNPVFEKELKKRSLYSDLLIEKVKANRGSIHGMAELPRDMRDIFRVAHDITPEWHIKMQAAFQGHVEQSISKTVNLPESATTQDVADAYMQAWESGCKGITVYRDGARPQQVLSTKYLPSERPSVLDGRTHKFVTGCGSLYVTVNKNLAGEVHEVFTAHSKNNGCVAALLNALSRVISIALRSGVAPEAIIKTTLGQSCGKCKDIASCADAVGRALWDESTKQEGPGPLTVCQAGQT